MKDGDEAVGQEVKKKPASWRVCGKQSPKKAVKKKKKKLRSEWGHVHSRLWHKTHTAELSKGEPPEVAKARASQACAELKKVWKPSDANE